MNFEQVFSSAIQRGAAGILSELGQQLSPDQQQFNSGLMNREQELRDRETRLSATYTNFNSMALRHNQMLLMVIESTKSIPSLYEAFANALQERGASIVDLERKRDAVGLCAALDLCLHHPFHAART